MGADFAAELVATFLHEAPGMRAAPQIRVGIGIATGEVMAGYAGTQDRGSCTCIGMTVNRAARLESHTRAVGCSMLVDQGTYRAVAARSAAEPIDNVTFKGFSEPLGICSLA
jgi:class 3 adenylate cyclase